MKRKALSILLAFCLLAGELFAFLPRTVGITAEAGTGKPESPSAYDLRPTPQLTALLERIEALEAATAAYYGTENTFGYVVRYLRSARYNDIKWQMLVGAPDSAYVSAMRAFDDLRRLEEVLLLEGDGFAYMLDFPHLCAAADAGLDFAGWAGDLITLAVEIGSQYEARRMLAGSGGSFGLYDYRADLDAKNLSALASENGGSLAMAMRSYYLEGGINTAITDFLRREMKDGGETLDAERTYRYFYDLLCGQNAQKETLFLAEAYGVKDDPRLRYVARAFAEELLHLRCSEIHGHREAEVFEVPATCNTNGYTLITCLCCEAVWETSVTQRLSHRYRLLEIPAAGDYPAVSVEICTLCGTRRS